MNHDVIDRRAYFDRIGYRGEERPTLAVLNAIVFCHATRIPFENFDPLLGVTVGLDPASLEQKLVKGGRGGYCFEHNLLLLNVLEQLDFRARPLSARVMWNRAATDPVTPRSHMLIEVSLEEGPHLADVGFGGLTLTSALRYEPGLSQDTAHDRVRLSRLDDDSVLEAELDGGFRALYRFDRARAYLSDYELASYYLCNSPKSHFKHGLMAARASEGGRFTLRGNVFVERRKGAEPLERVVREAAELRRVLAEYFELRLPETADFERVLEKVAAT
jgi:N-hydroxyarylamine O-acetyltransferase